MGNGTSSTSVSYLQRRSTVAALTQTTVDSLRSTAPGRRPTPLLTEDAWGAHVPDGNDVHAFLCNQAVTFAARGSAPLVKGEIVHLIMSIRNLRGVPITMSAYTALMHRGVDELFATLRAVIYAPDFLQPTIHAAVACCTAPAAAGAGAATATAAATTLPEPVSHDAKDESQIAASAPSAATTDFEL